MRLVDTVFRQGHLSERALVEALLTGDHPPHLDRCDICAERAVRLGRWLDEVRDFGVEAADAAFPAERLAAQQAQIMRRLELVDQPSRVIAFPGPTRLESPVLHARRVSPAWVGVAAAAGLILGVIGGQVTARLSGSDAGVVTRRATNDLPAPQGPSIFDYDLEDTALSGTPAGIIDEMTPRLIETVVSTRTGR